ncbi:MULTISPECIES: thiolase C-terminal domain-containing protein [Pigmentiphaga]|uniref:Thiolase family protein n=1 Tax=Pigmentiphaga daeguensis TaxID=414049 RepID=A0ABN1C8X1_9BURK
MSKVAIIGAAMSRFAKRPDASLQDIGWPVVLAALKDAQVDRSAIDAVYAGAAYSGRLVGQRVLRTLGMTSIPVTNCENACSSGATAFREACLAIKHGEIEVALVLGIDKLTALGGGVLPGQPDDWEVEVGLSMPALYSMRARRYMHEHRLDANDLAMVAVKAHRHGALNPYAQFNNEITVEQVAEARPVAEPFTLLHCCPTGDGAAAVIVCSENYVRSAARKPVWVAATELNSGRYMTGFRDLTTPEITVRGAKEAYELAGIGPEDIDVAEVHDAFTVAELLYYEAFGFCERGGALDLLRSGATSLGGRIPVNVSGGLLCKGHPVGATGIAQIAEVTWQLRGEAGARQVVGARTALTHCTGGGIAGFDHGACAINIFST